MRKILISGVSSHQQNSVLDRLLSTYGMEQGAFDNAWHPSMQHGVDKVYLGPSEHDVNNFYDPTIRERILRSYRYITHHIIIPYTVQVDGLWLQDGKLERVIRYMHEKHKPFIALLSSPHKETNWNTIVELLSSIQIVKSL